MKPIKLTLFFLLIITLSCSENNPVSFDDSPPLIVTDSENINLGYVRVWIKNVSVYEISSIVVLVFAETDDKTIGVGASQFLQGGSLPPGLYTYADVFIGVDFYDQLRFELFYDQK